MVEPVSDSLLVELPSSWEWSGRREADEDALAGT